MAVTAVIVAATAVSAGSQIYSGIQANKQAKKQATQLNQKADLALQESRIEATRKSEERTRFIAQQKVSFLANGLSLEGTPQAVFADTTNQYQQEIDAITRSGAADAAYYKSEASIAKSKGKTALISGVTGAVSTSLSSGLDLQKAGVFSSKSGGVL